MGGNGTEGATSETATMETDGELNHLVGGDALAFVFRVGQTCVRKVKGVVKFVLRQRLIGRVDDSITAIDLLNDALGGIFVRLLLDVTEVLGLGTFVTEAFLVAMEHDVVGTDASWYFIFLQEGHCLFLRKSCHEIAEHFHVNLAVLLHQQLCQRDHRLLPHTVDQQIGA